jgi:hypothetical protein
VIHAHLTTGLRPPQLDERQRQPVVVEVARLRTTRYRFEKPLVTSFVVVLPLPVIATTSPDRSDAVRQRLKRGGRVVNLNHDQDAV